MDPVQRVQDWRRQKLNAGFQAVTIWVKAEVKHRLQVLACERHQALGEVVTDALAAWEPAKAGKKAALTDRRQIQAIIRAEVAKVLSGENPAPDEEPLPMRQCKQGHAPYASYREECPECVRLRKRRQRARKAVARREEQP